MSFDKSKIPLIINDPDFIHSPKFENSLTKLLERYPLGITDKAIARVLVLSEAELALVWADVLECLRTSFQLGSDEELSDKPLPPKQP
jgi:hypothetical protein